MKRPRFTLAEIARHVEGELLGSGEVLITGLATIEEAGEGDLIRVDGRKEFLTAESAPAAALLIGGEIQECDRPAIRVANARLGFARCLELFEPEESTAPGVHPSASVAESVRLGEGCSIGAQVVIDEDVTLGNRVVIHPHVVIERGTQIGDDTRIFPNVTVHRDTQIGQRVRIQSGTSVGSEGFATEWDGKGHRRIPSIGNVIIEDDVDLGANMCIDRATTGSTVIGQGSKIDNLVQIAHNVQIDRHVIIAGCAGLAGSVQIGDGAILGAGVGVKDHVKIGAGSMMAAYSGIMWDVAPGEKVGGYPARPVREQLRIISALKHLPEMVKRDQARGQASLKTNPET